MPVIRQQAGTKPGTPKTARSPRSDSVLDRIGPVSFTDEGIKMLLYGRSGTGKTTLWATFPGPILVMVCSGGTKPGELRSVNTKEYRSKISQVVLETPEEVKEILDHVKDVGEYQTIVLDHASGLQDLVLKSILGIDELPAQKGWGLASQQQYGQCTLQCKEMLRSMLGLDANVVIVAQEREFNAESDSDLILPTVGAALSPSLTGWLNTACDYIVQTYIRSKSEVLKTKVGNQVVETINKLKGVDYCLRVGPDQTFTTKFRIPRGTTLPESILDPSYDKIMALISGGKD